MAFISVMQQVIYLRVFFTNMKCNKWLALPWNEENKVNFRSYQYKGNCKFVVWNNHISHFSKYQQNNMLAYTSATIKPSIIFVKFIIHKIP